MATKKIYEVRAVNTRTDQREFTVIRAYSEKQTRSYFIKTHGRHYVGFDIRESCMVGGPVQLFLF